MDKYAIYSYELTEKPRRNEVELPEMPSIEKMSLEGRFKSLFGTERGDELQLQKAGKYGTADKYNGYVLRHLNDIVLLRVENTKDKKIWEKQPSNNPVPPIEMTKRKSTPYCYVIIDNRPGHHLIAIQSNSEAWSNANKVKDLLQESFNWVLDVKNYGLEVDVQTKMMPSQFWEYVDYRRKMEHVYIKSMTFTFTNYKRRSDIDIKKALSKEWRHLESIVNMTDNLGGEKGVIKIEPPKDEALLKRKKEDIKRMVELCMNSNYSLSITFSDNITYKCNQDLRAELPMEDESIRQEFEYGVGDLFGNFRLAGWLDDVIEKTKRYNDIKEIRPKPNSKAKRKVS
ncbi:MAG: hypothetical protein IJ762_08115 [Bacteroidaceae bacterium]|nr:hypothetical protein [Bacteroidaceae bacterium]